jgi:hypothetical protein
MQPVEGGSILVHVLRLPAHRLGPGAAQPAKILVDAGLEFRATPNAVDVFDPEEKLPSASLRQLRVEESGIGVTEMQEAVRARGEAEHRCHESQTFRIRAQ